MLHPIFEQILNTFGMSNESEGEAYEQQNEGMHHKLFLQKLYYEQKLSAKDEIIKDQNAEYQRLRDLLDELIESTNVSDVIHKIKAYLNSKGYISVTDKLTNFDH